MEEKFFIIYMFTSPSGKRYIGQTCNLKNRIKHHLHSNKCTAFANAIYKYGFENFTLEILEENLSISEANIFEVLYIEQYNTLSPNGYNLQSGGLNYTPSRETLDKMRKVATGKYPSEETKEKNRVASSGKNNAMYGLPKELSPNFGKRGYKNKCSKHWIIIFPDGHEELIIGLEEFARCNNLQATHMADVAKGKAKQHKGFRCRYATPEEIVQK